MPSNYKPLTFNTSIRNPERAKYFLKTIIKFENEIMTNDLAKKSKKPIITSKSGIPYWFNKKFMLGPSIDINNEKQVINILNKLSYKSLFYKNFKKNVILRSKDNYVKKFYLNILKTLNFFK